MYAMTTDGLQRASQSCSPVARPLCVTEARDSTATLEKACQEVWPSDIHLKVVVKVRATQPIPS